MNEHDLFLKSDSALDQKIAECDDPAKISQIVKDHFAQQGVIGIERGNEFGAHVLRAPEPEPEPNAAPPATGWKYEYVFNFAPSSGRRSLILHANTPQDLDALIRQIEKTI